MAFLRLRVASAWRRRWLALVSLTLLGVRAVHVVPATAWLVVPGALIVALLAAVAPAWRAARLPVAEVLRSE